MASARRAWKGSGMVWTALVVAAWPGEQDCRSAPRLGRPLHFVQTLVGRQFQAALAQGCAVLAASLSAWHRAAAARWAYAQAREPAHGK